MKKRTSSKLKRKAVFSSESEDDVPLASPAKQIKSSVSGALKATTSVTGNGRESNGYANGKKARDDRKSSDGSYGEETPIKAKVKPKTKGKPAKKKIKIEEDEEDSPISNDDVPLSASRSKSSVANGRSKGKNKPKVEVESDEDGMDIDNESSSKKKKKAKPKIEAESDEDDMDIDNESSSKKKKAKTKNKEKEKEKGKAPVKKKKDGDKEGKVKKKEGDEEEEVFRWWDTPADIEGDGSVKWKTLVHSGVLFPPLYQLLPTDVKMKYNGTFYGTLSGLLAYPFPIGKPVDLPPESEEVAGFYGAMLNTDHAENEIFKKNFFNDFKTILRDYPPVRSFSSAITSPTDHALFSEMALRSLVLRIAILRRC
jgi:DNA topoisomerase-1